MSDTAFQWLMNLRLHLRNERLYKWRTGEDLYHLRANFAELGYPSFKALFEEEGFTETVVYERIGVWETYAIGCGIDPEIEDVKQASMRKLYAARSLAIDPASAWEIIQNAALMSPADWEVWLSSALLNNGIPSQCEGEPEDRVWAAKFVDRLFAKWGALVPLIYEELRRRVENA